MKVVKGVFFFAIIIFTYYCLLGYYNPRDGLPNGSFGFIFFIYVIAALHLWLLQRAFIWFKGAEIKVPWAQDVD